MIRNALAAAALAVATLALAGAVEPAQATTCAPGVVCDPPPCTTKSCPNYGPGYGPTPAPASDPVTAPASEPASSPVVKRCPHRHHLGHLGHR